MAKIKVTNTGRARRMLQYNLPHDKYCEEVGKCSCEEKKFRSLDLNPKTGEKLPRERVVKVCDVIYIPHKRSKLVHEAILKCPGVAKDIKKGWLKVG